MEILQKEYQAFLKRFEPNFKHSLAHSSYSLKSIFSKNCFFLFQEAALRPSKRLRPFFIDLAYRAGGGKNEMQSIKVGIAMELLHTALLIQDDVIDRSLMRRRAPTIHTLIFQKNKKRLDASHYSESTAYLLSDFGIHMAYHLIHSLHNDAVEDQYFTMLMETIIGEQIDIDLSFFRQYQKKELLEKVLSLKSGRYSLDRPFAMGLELAGKTRFIPQFLEFSNPLGRVFQIVDDYLGIFGKEDEIGKSSDSDLREGKATLIIYFGWQNATAKEKKMILSALGNPKASKNELSAVKSILGKYAPQSVRGYIERTIATSSQAVDKLPISQYYKNVLRGLIEYLAKRRF